MSEQTYKLKIPPAVMEHVKPDAPKDKKMMAASGVLPLPPSSLAVVLTFLINDSDEEVAQTAKQELLSMPNSLVLSIVSSDLHPKTLDFFAKHKLEQEDIMEAILLNPHTSDACVESLAALVSESHGNIIANNQVRLLRCPKIALELKKNPNSSKSTIDRVMSFLKISGVEVEGESCELSDLEIKELLNMKEADIEIPEELLEEIPLDAPEEVKEEKRKSLLQLLQTMNVSQKIKLALKGNKEARSALIKEPNKIISSAVVKSPKITETEIMTIANMRSVNEEVIRIIANRPDWTKNYNLQVILAGNPKTPFANALKFTRQMLVSDLQKLSKNKNAPAQLVKIAKELYNQKRR